MEGSPDSECEVDSNQPLLFKSAVIDEKDDGVDRGNERISILSHSNSSALKSKNYKYSLNSLAGVMLPDKYIIHQESLSQNEQMFKVTSLIVLLVWLTIIFLIRHYAPPSSFQLVSGVERHVLITGLLLLLVSNFAGFLPLLFSNRKVTTRSGIIIGLSTVQFISMTTNVLLAFTSSPSLIDPFTSNRVQLYRWAEWIPLSVAMMIFTEGVDLPHPRYGNTIGIAHAFCHGICTSAGLIFPLLNSARSWFCVMTCACLLFSTIFFRLFFKFRALRKLEKQVGTEDQDCGDRPYPNSFKSVDETEIYDRARLSFRLLLTCAITWTAFVITYFFCLLAPVYAPEDAILVVHNDTLKDVTEIFFEVCSKILYLRIVLRVHETIFDDTGRAERRLAELRKMMNVVWENSSDVICISVYNANNRIVTTMVSPTYEKLEKTLTENTTTLNGESGDDVDIDKDSKKNADGSTQSETESNTEDRLKSLVFELALDKEKNNKQMPIDGSNHKKSCESSSPESLLSPLYTNPVPINIYRVNLDPSSTTDDSTSHITSTSKFQFSFPFLRRKTADTKSPSVESRKSKYKDNRASRILFPETFPMDSDSPILEALGELVTLAWESRANESIVMHDLKASVAVKHNKDRRKTSEKTKSSPEKKVTKVTCETKITRLSSNALVVVIRDISERFKLFETEKQVVVEITARQKDAEANRFTRHEVKNGLLAAIGLCDSLKEAFCDSIEKQRQQQQQNQMEDTVDFKHEREQAQETEKVVTENPLHVERHSDVSTPMIDDVSTIHSATASSSSLIQGFPLSSTHAVSTNSTDPLFSSAFYKYQSQLQHSLRIPSGDIAKFDVRQCILELDSTLREVLDTILSQSMARDLMHGVYKPKVEKVDICGVLYGIKKESYYREIISEKQERFPLVTFPSPLPLFMFDPQLLKFIHRNAVINACKYGKQGAVVMTEIRFDPIKSEIQMDVINFPGEHHKKLLEMGEIAEDAVFAPGKRLHPSLGIKTISEVPMINRLYHSSGDGAWIMRKCAMTLGGECKIKFTPEKTIFTFNCPVTPVKSIGREDSVRGSEKFCLPSNTWGIAIDDSKVQRKLMERFLVLLGVEKSKRVVLGKNADEIIQFKDFMLDLIISNKSDYFLVIVDENLDIVVDAAHHDTVSGSRFVELIRNELEDEDEARILTIVRSANDSSDDINIYIKRAHGFLAKTPMHRDKVLEVIAPMWKKRFTDDKSSTLDGDTFHDEGGDTLISSADLMQTVSIIDSLSTQADTKSVLENWPAIWEKLVVLKGDLKTMDDNVRKVAVIEAIDKLRGSTAPPDLIERWMLIRSLTMSFIRG